MDKVIIEEERGNPPEQRLATERNNELTNNVNNKFIMNQFDSDPPDFEIVVVKMDSSLLLHMKTEEYDEYEDHLSQGPSTSFSNAESNIYGEKLSSYSDCQNSCNWKDVNNLNNLNSVAIKLEMEEVIIKNEDDDPTENLVTIEGNNLFLNDLNNNYIVIQSDSDSPRIYIRDLIANDVIKVNQSITNIDWVNKMLACYVRIDRFNGFGDSSKVQNSKYLPLQKSGAKGQKSFKCHQCDKSFPYNSRLKKHMLIHTGERPFKCTICDGDFTENWNLKSHMLSHKGEKPFKCNQCDKTFKHNSNCRKHMLIHKGEKPYKCDQCHRAFTSKWNLKSHMFVHKGEKPCKCNLCGKAFTQNCRFETHMLIHKGEKPFKCNQCDKAFPYKWNLKTHMLIHQDEKPFKCNQCDKFFRYTSNLKTHMLVHKREKSFKCNQCVKVFTANHSLKMHMFIHKEIL